MDAVKRAVITGATGAIGTALIRELIRYDIEILVLTREDSERNFVIPQNPLVKVLYCSLQQLHTLRLDSEKNYDVFFHLAWQGAAGAGRSDMYLQTENIQFALDAVGLAKRLGCHTFIGAGSQAEYGRQSAPLRADTPVFPEMGYGYAKLCAGQMTREYAHQLRMRHIWTRILSVYGPDDGKNSFISSVVQKCMKGERIRATKGEQYWDYLYSEDAASALRLIAEKGIDGKLYVLGSGQARPLKEYLYEIRDLIDPQLELGIGEIEYAENQMMYLCADISEVTKDTGWRPATTFRQGVLKCMESLSGESRYGGRLKGGV